MPTARGCLFLTGVFLIWWFTLPASVLYRLYLRCRSAAPAHADTSGDARPRCIAMCKATLDKTVSEKGIRAGASTYDDTWIRDAYFASLGLLRIGELAPVRNLLERFVKFQRSDGLVPLRLSEGEILWKMLRAMVGLPNPPCPVTPTYVDDKAGREPLDTCALTVILFMRYHAASGDADFVKTHFGAVERAMEWLIARPAKRGPLLWESYHCNWQDSLKFNDAVLYTNALYYEALLAFGEAHRLVRGEAHAPTAALAAEVRAAVQARFWNGRYFQVTAGWEVMDLAGNAICCLNGLATDEQAAKLFAHADAYPRKVALPVHFPSYPFKSKSWVLLGLGMENYHNGTTWPWFSFLFIAAAEARGLEARERPVLEALMCRDGGVYEVYEAHGWNAGRPLRTLFFSSESDFSAACGTYLYATAPQAAARAV